MFNPFKSTAFYSGGLALKPDPVVIGIMPVYICSVAFVVFLTERMEANFLKNGELQLSPWHVVSLRLPMVSLGEYFGIVNFLSPEDWLMGYGSMCYVAWMYLGVCIPRPPGKSKAREWYERALTWLNDRLTIPPEPVHQ